MRCVQPFALAVSGASLHTPIEALGAYSAFLGNDARAWPYPTCQPREYQVGIGSLLTARL